MSPDILARATTTELVYEALCRYGPLTEAEIGQMLSEPWQSTNAALNRLLLARCVDVERTADVEVVLYGVPL